MKFLTILLLPLATYALPQPPSPSPSASSSPTSPCSRDGISCSSGDTNYSQCANGELVSKGTIPSGLMCNTAGDGFTATAPNTNRLLDFQVVNSFPLEAVAAGSFSTTSTTDGGPTELVLISGPAINVTMVSGEGINNNNGNSTAAPKLSKRGPLACLRVCVCFPHSDFLSLALGLRC